MKRLLFAFIGLLAIGQASAQTFRIGLRQDPDQLDPTLGSSFVGRIVFAGMCDKLFDIDEALNIVPVLAESYQWKDPTHLQIRLRDGVLFHDGEKLDAEAVKYKLNRDLNAKGSMRRGEINAIESIDVADRLTLVLNLKNPSSPLLMQLTDRAGIAISPKAAEAAGDRFGQHPVCAGPFQFESRIAQDKIVLKRFPGYWNPGAIHFDQVVYHPNVNATARLANLQAGTLDLVEYIVPTDADAVRRDPKLRLVASGSLAYTGITFNTGNGAAANSIVGQNKLVRQAFELAIDREALVQVVFNGIHVPAAQANPPGSPYFMKSLTPPERDVGKAKALLLQSGVRLPVQVVLTVTNETDNMQAAEVIQSMARDAGFEVKIKSMEFASSLQAAYAGDFEAYLIGWSGRADPDGNMWQMLHGGGTFNYGHYQNADVDRGLDDARLVASVDQRRAAYAKVWQRLRDDLPLIYLWAPATVAGMRTAVAGFVPVPDGLIRLQGVTLR